MLAALEGTLQELFDLLGVALAHQLRGRQLAGRKCLEDIVVEFYQIVTGLFNGSNRLLRISILCVTQNTFGEGDTLNAAVAHLAVAGDGISVDVAAAIHMAGRQEALGLSVFGLVLLAQLREQRQ